MTFLFFFFLFILGLVCGSFLNVVIFRYDPEKPFFSVKNLRGRSRCMSCNRKLTWKELIPLVSFLLQRGRCLSCKSKLSFQYPAVELASGLSFIGVPLFLNAFYEMRNIAFALWELPTWYYALIFFWLLVFLIWILMTAIDVRHYIIPNELNLVLGICGIFIALITFFYHDSLPLFRDSFLKHYALMFSPLQGIIASRIFGLLVGGIFFGALSILSKGRAMGLGDVKLAIASGILFGWPDTPLIMILSFIMGGLYGIFLVFMEKREMKDRIPFAPFFILGSLLTFFSGFWLLEGYFNLFQI